MLTTLFIASVAALLNPDDTRSPLADHTPASVKSIAETALARYVNEDDGAFKWELIRTTPDSGLTIYDIRLTSQRWRTTTEVSEPLWTHWLTIGVPDTLRNTTPIMIIDGGRRRDQPRDKPRPEFLQLIRASGAVCCAIDNIPNQPLQLGDGKDRVEDDLLSQSWNLAIDKDDARWIGRFPMVKAVKRAMDAAEQFLARDLAPAKLDNKPLAQGFKPSGFFVTGASKRGWTTWLIGAVDPRVKAIAPVVIDVLNMQAQTPHHWQSYGFWAPALKDYVNNGIDKKFGTPELAKVIAHEDPLAYMPFLERLPKYIVTASGDEFFPTDSFQHYQDTLKGDWRLRTVPNAGHNLAGSIAPLEILAFYNSIVDNKPLPTWTWSTTAEKNTITLTATASAAPARVLLWQCDNPKARDFRLDQTGRTWSSTELSPTSPTSTATDAHTYAATIDAPATGYRAFMMEATFPTSNPLLPLTFTTRVYITPDTLPFKK